MWEGLITRQIILSSISGNTVIGDEGKILETDLTSTIYLKEFNFEWSI